MMPRRIISFDVGVRNMAFAVCRSEDDGHLTVERTGRESFPTGTTINALAALIVDWCAREFSDVEWDAVLVENQLGIRMKAVQTVLVTHFLTVARDVRHEAHGGSREVTGVSPRIKLRGCEQGASYARRKAFCVEQVAARGGEGLVAGQRKADDVCDAVMQALAWCVDRGLLGEDARLVLLT